MKRDFSRQSFLGPDSEAVLASIKIGIAGAGGAGSHMVQQFAHCGVRNILVADEQIVENSNLNRLVGATYQDVIDATPKVAVMERLAKAIEPSIAIRGLKKKWQEVQVAFRDCSVLCGAVDSFSEREQLERFTRRFGIIYIDVGMDVRPIGGNFVVSGQVMISMPGGACMKCLGLITEQNLKEEAALYGAAGANPQVIWANGILASTAVAQLVQLVTPWHSVAPAICLEYDGNAGTVTVSNRLKHVQLPPCPHFKQDEVGDPYFGESF